MSSNRVKRLLKKIENFRGKNKRRRISGCSDDDCGQGSSNVWTPKLFGDYPSSNIYNSTARSQPAELFRKDLISAMKLPDSEPLTPDDYWFISDQWKQEWEKGVQVPVNPDALPEPVVRTKKKERVTESKLPKKLIRITQNDFYSSEFHQLSNVKTQAENVCRYDLDDNDVNWLTIINRRFNDQGLPTINEETMEKVMEGFETQCYENMQEIIQGETGLGIEFDEDVICDVCRSPDSEEGNEMVFCDSCDICVHQACYGITEIPTGSWICRGCDSGLKPSCILCPNKGGALKCTRTGQQWVHVSCALWIPEVSIGCVEKMEPITKLANIPPSRWTLVCCVCKEKMGACIQCSVKACKTAYHVTCGFRGGLEMKAVMVDEEDEDGLKLRSYCPKHSKNKPHMSPESDDESSEKQLDKNDEKHSRLQRLLEIEAGFYKHVNISDVAASVSVSKDVVDYIYNYWKLKRRAAFNKPLLIPRSGQNDELEQEDSVFARMKMFVQIRQDLERVRNLCYMVTRREKLSRTWCNAREEIFQQQVTVLSDLSMKLSEKEKTAVIHACHGSNVYDRLSSFKNCCCQAKDEVSTPIANNSLLESELEKSKRNTPNSRLPNPYAKTYAITRSCRLSRRHRERLVSDSNRVSETVTSCADGDSTLKNVFDLNQTPCIRTLNENGNGSRSSISTLNKQSSLKVETVSNDTDYESVQLCHQRSTRSRQRFATSESADGTNETLEEGDVNSRRDTCVNEDESNKSMDGTLEKREDELAENISGRSGKSTTRRASRKVKLTKCRLKELVSKVNSTEDVSQFRDKQKQESEKVHESLFSTSQKGRLAGYRIPKKPRGSESRNETKVTESPVKQEVTATNTGAQETLPQVTPPKDPRLSSPNFASPIHPPPTPPLYPFKVTSPQLQQISNAPRSPRNAVPPVTYPDGAYTPRLVMKLRKDRNLPESQQQWMRTNDMATSAGVYEFPCEQTESPPIQGCPVNVKHEPTSSYYEYPKKQLQHPPRFPVAVGRRTEVQPSVKRTRNFNNSSGSNNNNNYSGVRPSRTNIVNSVTVHSIQSTYY